MPHAAIPNLSRYRRPNLSLSLALSLHVRVSAFHLPISDLSGHAAPVVAVCWSPSEHDLVSGDEHGDIIIWGGDEVPTPVPPKALPPPPTPPRQSASSVSSVSSMGARERDALPPMPQDMPFDGGSDSDDASLPLPPVPPGG